MLKKATLQDLDEMETILNKAKAYMASFSLDQWQKGSPNRNMLRKDIQNGNSWLYLEDGEILGFCALIEGTEPTYGIIEGSWLNDEPYLTVHRFATDVEKKKKDSAKNFLKEIEALGLSHNIRIDTHRDNLPMNRLLLSGGYTYCGIIWLEDGDERKAYQKIL